MPGFAINPNSKAAEAYHDFKKRTAEYPGIAAVW
jgi:hypothetical protein